ncbi:MAG: hypothetical protein LAN63_03075 [Acidobacteriia bacterium]|nr:hypothetical protein [Terriglobia bacterium]
MRIATFLFALSLVTGLVLAETSSVWRPSAVPVAPVQVAQGEADFQSGGDGIRMWRRAEIRVVPLDLAAADRAELQSLRTRIAEAEMDAARVAPSDPAVREQFARQVQLMRALLGFAERQDSDRGKSPTALQVQQHLNRIEGQVMCEACHNRIVAGSDGGGRQQK